MKLLRIGNSDDTHGPVEPQQRTWHIVQDSLQETLGEPVETVLKSAWPNEAYADVIERWVEREAPDAVTLIVSSFWVSYPSAPLRLQRSRLPGAARLASLGLRAAGVPRIAHNGAFRFVRHLALGSVGYGYYLEPAEAAARVEDAIRRILRREEIALTVRGPRRLGTPLPARLQAESEARCSDLDRRVAETCARLHVLYQHSDADGWPAPEELQADLMHLNALGHARRADQEFDAMLRAWRALHPAPVR